MVSVGGSGGGGGGVRERVFGDTVEKGKGGYYYCMFCPSLTPSTAGLLINGIKIMTSHGQIS